MSSNRLQRTWVIAAAIGALAAGLVACGKKEPAEPPPAPGPSAASLALQPLIEQYAKIERPDDDESGSLQDVSLEAFQQQIQTRRDLLDKVRQIDSAGLLREEDID